MDYEIKYYLILKEIFWKDRENLFLKLHTKNARYEHRAEMSMS